MAKVKNPLLSGDARGDFGKKMIFRRGGVVSKYFIPKDPKTIAQVNHRTAFRNYYMAALTQAQADLLYAAIIHLHDDRYSLLDHLHDDRYSLLDHLHDARYSLLTHGHALQAHQHASDIGMIEQVSRGVGDRRYSPVQHAHPARLTDSSWLETQVFS